MWGWAGLVHVGTPPVLACDSFPTLSSTLSPQAGLRPLWSNGLVCRRGCGAGGRSGM